MRKEANKSGVESAVLEKIFWDHKLEEYNTLKVNNEKDYEQYFLSYSHLRYILDFFGAIKGKKILDLGCGTGWVSLYLARSEADVYCCDVSPKAIEATQEMARVNNVKVEADVMTAERLKYGDEFFDFVFGNAVLHHTELPQAREEIYRCLKKDGRAAFIEPLVYSPLLRLYRRLSRHAHSPGEHPLTYEDIHTFGKPFSEVSSKEFEFFVLPGDLRKKFKPYLEKIEPKILGTCPFLRRYCSTVVIRVVK